MTELSFQSLLADIHKANQWVVPTIKGFSKHPFISEVKDERMIGGQITLSIIDGFESNGNSFIREKTTHLCGLMLNTIKPTTKNK